MSKSVGPIGANGHGEFWDEWRKIEGKVRADCEKRAQCVQDAEEIFSQTRLAACRTLRSSPAGAHSTRGPSALLATTSPTF